MTASRPEILRGAFDARLPKATGQRPDPGFSLVELLAVVAILAVLASIALPLAELSHQRTNEEDLRRSLREIRTAIDAYKLLADQGHIQKSVDSSGYPPDLKALVEGVVDAKSPVSRRIFLLRRLPRDPFAPKEITEPADTWALRGYASAPDHPQPGKDVFDVHSMSPGTALDGSAYRRW